MWQRNSASPALWGGAQRTDRVSSIPQRFLRTDQWQDALREMGPAVYACIGTDRSTGDALGPLVGTLLVEAGAPNVHGTLDKPLHRGNLGALQPLVERSAEIQGLPVLAIDACLGTLDRVGKIRYGTGPIRPGSGVNKELTPIGDCHLAVTVNVGGFMEYVVLQNTRLELVYRLARAIAGEIIAIHAAAQVAATTPDRSMAE